MSQNKTQIQGLEGFETTNGNFGTNLENNFYSRSESTPKNGTVVAGIQMGEHAPVSQPVVPNQPSMAPGSKPVVGFLYSVSRTPAGEYWPLKVGPNVIGTDPKCDICLPEGTVSSEHAVLVVRKLKNPSKLIASLSDARSTNGTMLNGQSLGFTAVDCANADVITIGENYELFVVLIDTATLGLTPSENFIHVDLMAEEDDALPLQPGFGGPSTPPSFNPYAGGFTGGTVGLDGSVDGNNRGGTVGM